MNGPGAARCWTIAAVIVLLLAASARAQQPLLALAPRTYVDALAAVLPAVLAQSVRVLPLEGADAELPAAVWCVDEWTMMRSAAQPVAETSVYLPFTTDYVLLTKAGVFAPRVWTWQEIALAAELHDRLALVDPGSDGGAWAAMLRGELQRGRSRRDVISLWMTFDARAGHLCADLDEAVLRFATGGADGLIVPRGGALRHPRLQRDDVVRHDIAAAQVRLGVYVRPGAEASWGAVLHGLDRDALLRIATAVGLDLAAPGQAPLPADIAAELLAEFEQHVRGRGRAVEDLADWIDLLFVVASLGLVLLVWRRQRR